MADKKLHGQELLSRTLYCQTCSRAIWRESSVLSSWMSTSVAESHLDRGHTFPRFVHLQWLTQGRVKRFAILAQCGTALKANMCFSAPFAGWTKALSGLNCHSTCNGLQKKLTCKKLQFDLCSILPPSPSFHRFRFLKFQHRLLQGSQSVPEVGTSLYLLNVSLVFHEYGVLTLT